MTVRLFRCVDHNCIVGVVEDRTASAWTLSRAAQIRYWGTTKGFAELTSGPRPSTIVDHFSVADGSPFEIHESKIIYSCPASGWDEVFK